SERLKPFGAVKFASVPTWLAPEKLAVVIALPDSVPAFRLPVSLMELWLATRLATPVTPTEPPMSIDPAVKVADSPDRPPGTLSPNVPVFKEIAPDVAETTPVTVSASPSNRVNPLGAAKFASVPIRFAPVKLAVVIALPVNVPAFRVPVWPMELWLAIKSATPLTPRLPPRVIDPAVKVADRPDRPPGTLSPNVPMFSAIAPEPAETAPVTARASPSERLKPFGAVKFASVPTWLAPVKL